MLLAGDEFGNSQQGNNNAYAQDNELGWLDWSALDEDSGFADEVRELLHLRKEWPLLRLTEYLHGETELGASELNLHWLSSDGEEMDERSWSGPAGFKVLLAESTRGGKRSCVAVLINNRNEAVEFRLPDGDAVRQWRIAWSIDELDLEADGRTVIAPPRSISLVVTDR